MTGAHENRDIQSFVDLGSVKNCCLGDLEINRGFFTKVMNSKSRTSYFNFQ